MSRASREVKQDGSRFSAELNSDLPVANVSLLMCGREVHARRTVCTRVYEKSDEDASVEWRRS